MGQNPQKQDSVIDRTHKSHRHLLSAFNKQKTEAGFSVLRLLIGMFAIWAGAAAREKYPCVRYRYEKRLPVGSLFHINNGQGCFSRAAAPAQRANISIKRRRTEKPSSVFSLLKISSIYRWCLCVPSMTESCFCGFCPKTGLRPIFFSCENW